MSGAAPETGRVEERREGLKKASNLESEAFASIRMWRVSSHFPNCLHDEAVSPKPGN